MEKCSNKQSNLKFPFLFFKFFYFFLDKINIPITSHNRNSKKLFNKSVKLVHLSNVKFFHRKLKYFIAN